MCVDFGRFNTIIFMKYNWRILRVTLRLGVRYCLRVQPLEQKLNLNIRVVGIWCALPTE